MNDSSFFIREDKEDQSYKEKAKAMIYKVVDKENHNLIKLDNQNIDQNFEFDEPKFGKQVSYNQISSTNYSNRIVVSNSNRYSTNSA